MQAIIFLFFYFAYCRNPLWHWVLKELIFLEKIFSGKKKNKFKKDICV